MSKAMDAFMRRARELNCTPDAVDDFLSGRVIGVQDMNTDVIRLADGRIICSVDFIKRRREL